VVTSLERPRHTNLDEKIRRGEPPVVSDIVKMIKNVFSELEGNNWAKIACGNISRQALSACLAESQFKGCATQQTPRFWATVLLGGHLFEIHWICRRHGGNWSSSCLVWVGQKIGNYIFSNRANTKFAHYTLKRMPNGAVVWVKWGLEHEKWQWQVVCDLSKVEMLNLCKNGGNVWWLHGQLIIHDQKWNNVIPCLWVCGRKNQVVANGHLIFVAWPPWYEYQRRQWLKKV
jgi:hypothetical protein